ncbi:MAG: J domain-containing protein [Alphaproteobacteria bacterium]
MARKKSFDDVFDPLRKFRPKSVRFCDHERCAERELYRAPKAPDDLHSYYWFCLKHVQAYNKSWNYYADMTADQIEAQIKFDTIWQRPTWPLGGRPTKGPAPRPEDADDPFDLFGEERARQSYGRASANGSPGSAAFGQAGREVQAMAILELTPPLSLRELKARFKELVKKLHPDANGGDRRAEDKLRLVIEAYAVLKPELLHGDRAASA